MTWDELPAASYGVCEVMSACIMWCCEVVRTQDVVASRDPKDTGMEDISIAAVA